MGTSTALTGHIAQDLQSDERFHEICRMVKQSIVISHASITAPEQCCYSRLQHDLLTLMFNIRHAYRMQLIKHRPYHDLRHPSCCSQQVCLRTYMAVEMSKRYSLQEKVATCRCMCHSTPRASGTAKSNTVQHPVLLSIQATSKVNCRC